MVTVKVPTKRHHHRGVPLKSAKDRMDIISAYQQVGSYRGAADLCHTTPKTVKRIVRKFEAGENAPARAQRAHNYAVAVRRVRHRPESLHHVGVDR